MQTNFRLEYDSTFNNSDPWQGMRDTSGRSLYTGPFDFLFAFSLSDSPWLVRTTDRIIIR